MLPNKEMLLTLKSSRFFIQALPSASLEMPNPFLATLDGQGWQIDDGEVTHAEHPDSYWIPPLKERQSLPKGAYAKMRFYMRVANQTGKVVDCGERMWVEVTGRVGRWYRGRLSNQPVFTDSIEPMMEVWFEPRHIIDIQLPDQGVKESEGREIDKPGKLLPVPSASFS
jgi:hypothetical protein